MPRKSVASLTILSAADPPTTGRLRPPPHLSEAATIVFKELVSAASPDHFAHSDMPLLASYAEAIVIARQSAEALEREGAVISGRTSPWLTVREKSVREMVALSMRLRLAPQSRLKAEAVGRRPGGRPNYLDTVIDDE
jgi:P27 family predicted phage terminase small subunit